MSLPILGRGIVKGLVETARNFAGSYVKKERLTTVQYPEERLPQMEAARNFPFLVYDGQDWQKGLRCVACLICEKECPPQCIYIVKDAVRKPDAAGKLQFQPKVFDIDTSVCMSCQICVEVCPFDAIKMDVEYELSTGDRFEGLLWHKQQLAKSALWSKSLPNRSSVLNSNSVFILIESKGQTSTQIWQLMHTEMSRSKTRGRRSALPFASRSSTM